MPIGGRNTKWAHGTHGALTTETDFTTKTRSVDMTLDGEQVDTTTFGDGYRKYEQSFKNGEIEVTYLYDATLFGQLAAIYDGSDEVEFEYGPDGDDSGKPKVTGEMFITSLGMPAEVGEALEITVTWQVTGPVAFSTY